MTFAERLSGLMAENKLSKLALSKKIGVSDRVVGAWVSGENGANLASAVAIADYFAVSLDYLSGRSDVREMGAKKEPPLGCSEEAASLAARYDGLDDDGKAMVRCAIVTEERRLVEEKDGLAQSPSEGKAV